MRYIWNRTKNLINIRDYGIDFFTAKKVFGDSNRIEFYDKKHSEVENRWTTIGFADGRLLTVSYTVRGKKEKTRIISW